jgi:hypothetical protein
MKVFDIHIAYISYNGGGKKRPILILKADDEFVYAYSITTKYANKSEKIRTNYFKINDWKFAGLNEQSYIDTNSNELPKIPRSLIDENCIGSLSDNDKQRLIRFLNR